MSYADICYTPGARVAACGRVDRHEQQAAYEAIRRLPVYEGFLTYGGMSAKEVEAMAVGIREMTELEVAGSSADLIQYFVGRLVESGVPVVTPPGGLACHVDATRFLPHIPQREYPAGALAAAIYIASGIRSMERGTVSSTRAGGKACFGSGAGAVGGAPAGLSSAR